MPDAADKNVNERWVDALRQAGVPDSTIATALGQVATQESEALQQVVRRFGASIEGHGPYR